MDESDQEVTERLGNLLGRRLSYEVVMLHSAVGQRLGLSLADHKYLDLIDREGPLTAGRLAELTGLTTGAVTALVDRLATAELITRTTDDRDRRRVVIAAQGPRLAEIGAAMGTLGERMRPVVAQHSSDELNLIAGFLESLLDAVRQTRIELENQG